jgi:hypothetical protein
LPFCINKPALVNQNRERFASEIRRNISALLKNGRFFEQKGIFSLEEKKAQ